MRLAHRVKHAHGVWYPAGDRIIAARRLWRLAVLLQLMLSAAADAQAQGRWQQLPAFGAAISRCHGLPGFQAQDVFPTRSPLVVADHLISLVEGKAFAEVGTRNGDIMGCVKHFATSVTAVELDRAHCKVLEKRGFRVVCRDFLSLQPHEMPLADVLYWWPQMSWDQNEAWMRHTMRGCAPCHLRRSSES